MMRIVDFTRDMNSDKFADWVKQMNKQHDQQIPIETFGNGRAIKAELLRNQVTQQLLIVITSRHVNNM